MTGGLFSRAGGFVRDMTGGSPAPQQQTQVPAQTPQQSGMPSQIPNGNNISGGNVPPQSGAGENNTSPPAKDPFTLAPKQTAGLTPEQIAAQRTERANGIKQFVGGLQFNAGLTEEQNQRIQSGDVAGVMSEKMIEIAQQAVSHAVSAMLNFNDASMKEYVQQAVQASVFENRTITNVEAATSSIRDKFPALKSDEFTGLIHKTLHQYRNSGMTFAEAEAETEKYFGTMFQRKGGATQGTGGNYRGSAFAENPNGDDFDWTKFASV